MMKTLLLFAFAGMIARADCTAVTGSRVVAADLSRADSRYSALPSGVIAGFAPAPGARRLFTAIELSRLARANGVAIDQTADLCFEFPVHPLNADEVLAAMRRSLPAGASIEIVRLSPAPIPAGQLQFPADGLDKQTWRGYVSYAENRRAPVWADVHLAVITTSVVAAADLAAEVAIRASSLRLVTTNTSSLREVSSLRIEDVAGLAPRMPIRAGSVIRTSDLVSPPAIRRGESVRVEVQSGPARLHFEAIAESAARVGEMVELRSPLNGKTVRARVDAPAKAVVVVGRQEL